LNTHLTINSATSLPSGKRAGVAGRQAWAWRGRHGRRLRLAGCGRQTHTAHTPLLHYTHTFTYTHPLSHTAHLHTLHTHQTQEGGGGKGRSSVCAINMNVAGRGLFMGRRTRTSRRTPTSHPHTPTPGSLFFPARDTDCNCQTIQFQGITCAVWFPTRQFLQAGVRPRPSIPAGLTAYRGWLRVWCGNSPSCTQHLPVHSRERGSMSGVALSNGRFQAGLTTTNQAAYRLAPHCP